jgi:hypothetical protein
MSESTALLAARQGRAALEAFQRANPGSTLDFGDVDFRDPQNEHIEFSGFEFLLDVDFSRAKFGDTPIPWRVHGYRPPTGPGPVLGAALFQKSVFHGRASFDHASFGLEARFDDSIFKVAANFVETNFAGDARFSRVVFQTVSFHGSIPGNHMHFDDILVVQDCSFDEMIFGQHVRFDRAFFGLAHFQSSLFGENASFESAVFTALAQFNNTEFEAGPIFPVCPSAPAPGSRRRPSAIMPPSRARAARPFSTSPTSEQNRCRRRTPRLLRTEHKRQIRPCLFERGFPAHRSPAELINTPPCSAWRRALQLESWRGRKSSHGGYGFCFIPRARCDEMGLLVAISAIAQSKVLPTSAEFVSSSLPISRTSILPQLWTLPRRGSAFEQRSGHAYGTGRQRRRR